MTFLSDFGERLRALLFRAREERAMDAEMRFHLDMATERLMREEGLPREEARRRAAVAFGGEDRYKEEVRDARGVRWIEQPLQDVRYALRGLKRTPVFTLAVVLTLALGIGATTSIFSVVYGVLLRALPYPNAGRIVTVHLGVRPFVRVRGGLALSDRAFRLFADDNRAFEAFGGARGSQRRVLTGGGGARAIQVGLLTPGAFRVLGVAPEMGRLPASGEGLTTDIRTGSLVPRSSAGAGGGRVVLLSDAFWRGRYGSDPGIVGRTVTLDGDPYVVIGVMPPSYDYPDPDDDAWIPIVSDPASTDWAVGYLDGLARLRPGWTTTMAAADAKRLIRRFGEIGYTRRWLDRILDGTARIMPLQDVVVGKARTPLLILLGVVGFVLLVACANVANLLLARADGRRRESAIRLALGAGRARVMRQHVTESVLLSLLGGAAGVLLAWLGTRTLVSLAPAAIPRLGDIGINGPVLGFTTCVSVLAGLFTGWLPALRAGSRRSLAALRDGGSTTPGRRRHRARNALVVAQVALALVLLVGAGLLVRSFRRLAAVDPGFRPEHVLTFDLGHPDRLHGAGQVAAFYDRLIERLEAIPGVSAAGAVNGLPLTGGGGLAAPRIREFPPAPGEPAPLFHIRLATPGYFRALGIPAVEGRLLNDDDGAASVVISRSVKQRYWPAISALGKQIGALAGLAPGAKFARGERPEARVVGVAGDVHDVALDSAADEILYYPVATDPFDIGQMSLVVRGAADPRALIPQVRRVVRALAPDVPITDLRPLRAVVSRSMSRTTFVMLLLTLAAAIALLLGAVGIYGVVSYTVSRRTPEIGVRLALGARPRRVMGGVLFQGMRLALVGVILGLVGAAGLGRVLASLLYGVKPLDPVTLAGGAGVFLAVAGLAAVAPAWRAARTEVAEVLRGE